MSLLQLLATVTPQSKIRFQIGTYNAKRETWINETIEDPETLQSGELFTAFVPKSEANDDFAFMGYSEVKSYSEFKSSKGIDMLRITCVRK